MNNLLLGKLMRSFKVRSTLWIAIVATALVYPQASAQGVVATGTQRTPATGSKIAVQAPVTVDFKDVRLYEALRIVAQQAGIELAYAPNTFPVSRRVTLRADNLPANKVIDKLVSGTGFQVRIWNDRDISLVN